MLDPPCDTTVFLNLGKRNSLANLIWLSQRNLPNAEQDDPLNISVS